MMKTDATGRQDDMPTAVPPLTLPIAFLAGWWVARPTDRAILNSALAGAIAIPLYVAIVIIALLAAPGRADTSMALSPAYIATHIIKVLGAAAGGWWVACKRAGSAHAA